MNYASYFFLYGKKILQQKKAEIFSHTSITQNKEKFSCRLAVQENRCCVIFIEIEKEEKKLEKLYKTSSPLSKSQPDLSLRYLLIFIASDQAQFI